MLQEFTCRSIFVRKAKRFLTKDSKYLATWVTLHKYRSFYKHVSFSVSGRKQHLRRKRSRKEKNSGKMGVDKSPCLVCSSAEFCKDLRLIWKPQIRPGYFYDQKPPLQLVWWVANIPFSRSWWGNHNTQYSVSHWYSKYPQCKYLLTYTTGEMTLLGYVPSFMAPCYKPLKG